MCEVITHCSRFVRRLPTEHCSFDARRPCRAALLISASALVFALHAAPSSADDASNIARIRRSIIFIEVTVTEPTGKITTETGTGFIITQSGYAVTANHLLMGPSAKVMASVGGRFGLKVPVYVCDIHGITDGALLQLPDSTAPYEPVTFDDPGGLAASDHLVAIGFPLDSDLSVSSGVLANKAGRDGLWQISVPLNFGNSGGPVIDSKGGVVGMVQGGISQAQQVNFMLPVNLLAPFITSAGLRWPPFDLRGAEAPPVSVSKVAPVLTPKPGQNCHEVVNIAVGFPPQYSKTIVCE
jgi:S1-C subfamily serine protease